MSRDQLIHLLKEEISKETGLSYDEIKDAAPFYSLQLDSISCVFVLDEISKKIDIELNPLFFWDYPTVELLADHILSLTKNDT
jgi:acyl carrier protein